ncbi:MAG: tetratricopeptide repeat protein, partial [Candidatus Aminicenantes bacterium]|nr:tetratricopeptide repeat protein [Candidatus Aminicenantes bacterium]
SKRRETVKKIFESNLLISGEAAINKIEDALIDFERAVLKTQNFRSLIQALSREQLLFRLNVLSENFPIEFFLLNSSFEIIFPRTGGSNKKVSQSEVGTFKINSFEKIFKRGEYYEFSLKKYTRAIEVYKECLKIAPSAQLQARVMEALGRSLLSAKRYNEALSAYQELYNEHKKFLNTASHPYGIISILQIAEINFCLNKKDMALKLLLDLYKEIRSGNWLLNISTYEFFVFEIESILNKFSGEKNFSKFNEALRTVQEQPSPYSRTLQIVEFLKNKIIPFISHRLELVQSRREAQIERFLAGNRRKTSLISFKTIPDLDNQSIHYGGICWDTRIIKNQ